MRGREDSAVRLFKATVVWLLIAVCAVLNGGFREAVLLPGLGMPAAIFLSGILLCVLIMVVSFVFIRWLGPLRTAQSLLVGLLWLFLTLAFEFGLGRFVQHREWSEILDAYTFKNGNLWPLVLVVTFLAPLSTVLAAA